MLYCRGRGAVAQGVYSSDGLTVSTGSKCATEPTDRAASDSLYARRARLIEDGTLAVVDGNTVFTRDTLFRTPSGASDVILYRSSSGWTEWKTQGGVKLNDVTGRGVERVETEG
jgi:hypothetical protein